MRSKLVLTIVLCISAARAVQSAPPASPVHPDNPVQRTEHEAMLDLIRDAEATFIAAKTGNWSDPTTWKQNAIPAPDAIVVIPRGIAVTVDAPIAAAVKNVRVDGTLRWETTRDSSLSVETIVFTPGAHWEMGTVENPVSAGATAKLIFTGTTSIDTSRDPFMLSHGLISHGVTRICGIEKTAYAQLARPPKQGDTVLLLKQPAKNWRKGDRMILPSVEYGNPDEDLTILDVRGEQVDVAPLRYDHVPPADDLAVYVANLSRNVVIDSQNPQGLARRGHVMFMHSGDVDVRFAAFNGLGRTDKSRPIDDPKLDADGKLIAGSGGNPRGRYAVHFHRTGALANRPAAVVAGCTVIDSPGWGFVNHSSHVDFEDNVSFNVFGSGFVTEAGDETGSFRHNLAIRSKGSGEDEAGRTKLQDFAHEGDGFWFQGGGVSVEDNIATGQRASGFIFFTAALIEDGLGPARFAVANLWKPEYQQISHVDQKDKFKISDPNTVPVGRVPVKSFKRNIAYACGTGFTARFMQPEPNRSVYEDGIVWNCDRGVRIRYTSHLDLRNCRLVGNPNSKSEIAAITGTLEGDQDLRYENLRVEGWSVGNVVPEVGHHVIAGGYWNNVRSIVIPSPMARDRRIEIEGDIKFGTLPADRLQGRRQLDVDLVATFSPMLDGPSGGHRDPNVLFASDRILMKSGPHSGKQLYYVEQEADHVPFPRERSRADIKALGQTVGSIPNELIGKSNQQMFEQYGLAIGGAVIPAGAERDPRIHGVIADASQYAKELRMTEYRTTSTRDFRLNVFYAGEKPRVSAASVDLHSGWNLISQNIEGSVRSFLVFSGQSKPAYVDKSGNGPGKKAGNFP